MKLIIDIPEEVYKHGTLGLYFDCYSEKLHDTILNGTPIPDNATVCDIEQIRAEIADLPIRPEYQQTEHEKGFIEATNRALQIIDKYKGDKE